MQQWMLHIIKLHWLFLLPSLGICEKGRLQFQERGTDIGEP